MKHFNIADICKGEFYLFTYLLTYFFLTWITLFVRLYTPVCLCAYSSLAHIFMRLDGWKSYLITFSTTRRCTTKMIGLSSMFVSTTCVILCEFRSAFLVLFHTAFRSLKRQICFSRNTSFHFQFHFFGVRTKFLNVCLCRFVYRSITFGIHFVN